MRSGGDIGQPIADIDSCRAACRQNPSCVAITMYKKLGSCQLKSHGRTAPHSDWYSEAKAEYSSPLAETKWLVLPDYYISDGGSALTQVYWTLPECRAACEALSTCIAITQNEQSNECFLKSQADVYPHEHWHTEVRQDFKHLIKI